ncbi:MAG: hypothetical protein IJK89_03650 [Clostridia bacterium]|nr:hypothetical protein [Clostridia bacterium]
MQERDLPRFGAAVKDERQKQARLIPSGTGCAGRVFSFVGIFSFFLFFSFLFPSLFSLLFYSFLFLFFSSLLYVTMCEKSVTM